LAGAIRSAHKLDLTDKQQKYSAKLTSEFSASDEANQIKKEGL
jgi:Tfp pilus assembly protein PilF